ncbi:hypothetical protein ElyMa_004926300 [Elysia marginata]|uniref:Uncharacterized protein n=1 Tax=Elysia marginata TaxID=1093978 RepID=A0AAV4IYG2_9GAST|nr:hypothetical protein ElyMa_004926300 [Elysia marginata]
MVIFVSMDSVQLSNFVRLDSRYELSCGGDFQLLVTSISVQPPPPSHCYIQCSKACWSFPECIAFAFSPTSLKKYFKTSTSDVVCPCYNCQLQNETGVKYLWKPSSFETWVHQQNMSVLRIERVGNVTSSASKVAKSASKLSN